MAFNKKNYYKKIIKIQEITKKELQNGILSQKEIFFQMIEPEFDISIRTFQTYLGVPAKRELKKLEELEKSTQ